MTEDFMGDRKRAMEESFFRQADAELVRKLKEKDARKARLQTLAEISGIENEDVLHRLVELNISSETLAALTLIPLVEVAWADGSLHEKERSAVLRAAEQQGIEEGHPAHDLLENWLKHAPEKDVLKTWKAYIGELAKRMSEREKEELRSQIVSRARRIAGAAGGFLGMNKISDREEAVLKDLESAF